MSLFYALIGCILVCCHLELKISIFILICFLTVSRIIFASFCFCPMLFLHLYTFKLFAQTWMCFCQKPLKRNIHPLTIGAEGAKTKWGKGGNIFLYTLYIYIIILKYVLYHYSVESNLRLGRLRQQVEKHESFLYVHVLKYKQHPSINIYTASIVRSIGYNKKHVNFFFLEISSKGSSDTEDNYLILINSMRRKCNSFNISHGHFTYGRRQQHNGGNAHIRTVLFPLSQACYFLRTFDYELNGGQAHDD